MSALAAPTRPSDGDTDDRDLVARVGAGDDRAFELLFQRYQPRIAAYVRGMVRDDGRAEDITQEVFMAALRRMREETEREILFKPWIFEIAKNRCIDAFRRTRNRREVSFDAFGAVDADEHGRLAEPAATPDLAVEGKVAIDNLCGAFGGLSALHHEILVMREFEGLSYREIGDRLGMSRPAVESTLFRARKRLSQEYEELVSGERCRRIQRIVDTSGGRSAGLRDERRMARHLSHCEPCRRYARCAGIDLGRSGRPAALRSAAARTAAVLPLPAFLRRRSAGDEPIPLLGHGGPFSQWSANAAATIDPGLASSWIKAVATAATVAVAGMGAGGAFSARAPEASLLAPGSPFGQEAGLRVPAAGGGGSEASRGTPAKAAARSARAVRRARPGGERSQPAGRAAGTLPADLGRPARPADAPSRADSARRRPSGSQQGASPARRDGDAAPAVGGQMPDPGDAVGQVLGTVGTAGGARPGSGSSGGGAASPGLAQPPDAPSPTTPAAPDLSSEPVTADVPAPTEPVGSVPGTVPDAPSPTTPAPPDLER